MDPMEKAAITIIPHMTNPKMAKNFAHLAVCSRNKRAEASTCKAGEGGVGSVGGREKSCSMVVGFGSLKVLTESVKKKY